MTSVKFSTRSKFIFGLAIIALIAAGSGIFFILTHRNATPTSSEIAEREFSALKERFLGTTPLIDMNSRVAPEFPVDSVFKIPIHSFHTTIFDTRGSPRLIHITVPYWFARLFANQDHKFVWLGQLTFLDDTEFDPEGIQLSLEQIERHGPGLITYFRHDGGGQFISWTE